VCIRQFQVYLFCLLKHTFNLSLSEHHIFTMSDLNLHYQLMKLYWDTMSEWKKFKNHSHSQLTSQPANQPTIQPTLLTLPRKSCIFQFDTGWYNMGLKILPDSLLLQIFNFSLQYAIRKIQENQEGLELNEALQLLSYADDINTLSKSINTIKKNTETLLESY